MEKLWQPSLDQIQNTQMDQFRKWVNNTHNLALDSYSDLYNWSIEKTADFWESIWKFCGIKSHTPYTAVIDDPKKMPGAKWFEGATLNFAEHCLQFNDEKTAIIQKIPNQPAKHISYRSLRNQVEHVAAFFRSKGIQKGDRIGAIISNCPEAIIGMLAATSIGAIWSSCAPEFGEKGILDRFEQIQPKILIYINQYSLKGSPLDVSEKIKKVVDQLTPHLVAEILVSDSADTIFPNAVLFKEIQNIAPKLPLTFEPVSFDHPMYILYSSGTTGKPKSIVHGTGGTLIQHLKELKLHTNIKREDTLFYYTTCGWMMWNWFVSALALGATVVCFDEFPFFPEKTAMWDLIDELEITVFGTSAKYLSACEKFKVFPNRTHSLKSLRAILTTGSTLVPGSFDYVYSHIKADLQLSSISGGTDIVSCFALGNPILPVYRGELQCRGLGMDVQAQDDNGESVLNKKGELVCKTAFPSMPVFFWNDSDGKRYHDSYFSQYEGLWYHGDFLIISDHGGVQILGRSDTTLNPGGVRIGTAEIYAALDLIPEVIDSVVIGHQVEEDEVIILFVKLSEGRILDAPLTQIIKNTIKTNCSPRHVPKRVLQVPDIPYTLSGKKVELAVKRLYAGESYIPNKDALANPESLGYFTPKQTEKKLAD